MKTYFIKTSIVSVLLLALIPMAYARGRLLKPNKSGTLHNRVTTESTRAKEIEKETRRLNEAEASGQNLLSTGENVSVKPLAEIQHTVDTLATMSGVANGQRQAVVDFMQVPTASNTHISQQLMSMASAIKHISSQTVASSLRYVANIAGTKKTRGEEASPGNVLRSVGNHLHKATSWGAQPKATYNTFIKAYNNAKNTGKSPSMALKIAIAEAFKLTGEKATAKEAEIFRLCRA